MKLLWSWKWRTLAILLLIVTFVSEYPKGLWTAVISTFTLYAFYGLGQAVYLEIEESEETV